MAVAVGLALPLAAPVGAGFAETTVNITSTALTVYAGGDVNLTVTEKNTGDVELSNPYVVLDPGNMTLNKDSASYKGGDDNNNTMLDPGEMWEWSVTATVNATTTYTATGHGFAPSGQDITWPDCETEQDNVTVTVINPNTLVTVTPSANPVPPGTTAPPPGPTPVMDTL
jgi:hypothetical protein